MGTLFGPVGGVTLSLYAVQLLPAAVAQTIFSLMPGFAIFNARFFLKEPITLNSLMGAFVAIAGVILLVWRNSIF
jgi:drug/metabolite transporter (DMT)-like permease